MTASPLRVPLDWPFTEEFTAQLNVWLAWRGLDLQVLRNRANPLATIVIRFVAVERSGRVVVIKQLTVRPDENMEPRLRRVMSEWSA